MTGVLNVKQVGYVLLLLLVSQLGIAQEESENQEDQAVVDSQGAIGQRYIRDYLYVPLRSGESNSHRIVHKGLRSGSFVILLKTNDESEFSLVRTPKGVEGWIPTQYLMEEPPASIKLKEAEKTIQQLSSQAGPIGDKLVAAEKSNRELTRKVQKLEEENNQLNKELVHIKELSSNTLQLDSDNKKLLNDYQMVKNKRDTLKLENQRLEENLKNEEFINGALAVIFGIIATLIVQYLAKSNRRSSEWR